MQGRANYSPFLASSFAAKYSAANGIIRSGCSFNTCRHKPSKRDSNPGGIRNSEEKKERGYIRPIKRLQTNSNILHYKKNLMCGLSFSPPYLMAQRLRTFCYAVRNGCHANGQHFSRDPLINSTNEYLHVSAIWRPDDKISGFPGLFSPVLLSYTSMYIDRSPVCCPFIGI